METFKRLIHYSRPYWWRIAIAAAGSSIVGGMDALFAYLSGPIVKQLFATKDWSLLKFVPIGIIAIFTIRGLARYVNDYFIRTSGQLAIQDIRNELYRKNMGLGLAYFSRNQTGVLMSRVLNDVGLMQDGVANVVTGLFRDGLGAIFLLGVIFYLNWKLALIAFLVLPATVYPAQKIGRRIKNAVRQSQEKIGDLAAILQESYSGIKVIKAFNMAWREIERFTETNQGFYHFLRKSIKYEGVAIPVMEFLSSLGVAAVVWASIAMIRSGSLTPEALISFVAAMILLYNPVKKLNSTYNTLQRALAAADRVFDSMDEAPEIVDPPSPHSLGRAGGRVELVNVSFSYGEENVLKNVSLLAGRGEVVALVGPSGGGKSTLVSLIPRFYDVTAGAVFIDGVDVREVRLADLMSQIALVDQETVLFNETIANNIRYGKPDASNAEVEGAARAAFAHEFILEMPDGYQTNIGDRGVRLSGGQRQRLCIARAILKDAPILILDEATSALDTESEQMVQNALNNLMANRTTFVIAHRLSTILNADRIVVIDQGEIAEEGSHEQLLRHAGLYKKLYDMQFQV